MNTITKSQIQNTDAKWLIALIVFVLPAVTMVAVPWYAFQVGYTMWEVLIVFMFYIAAGISITAGYHKMWSHNSFKGGVLMRLFFAIFGASAMMGSAYRWVSNHRNHHTYPGDEYGDPYAIEPGFWYAHCGNLFKSKYTKWEMNNISDLKDDWVARFQDKYLIYINLIMNIVIPIVIGYFIGSIWGMLTLSMLRVCIVHQGSFSVNSICHMWGTKPHDKKTTATDNIWIAIITYGEGFHNYHHTYPLDYRCNSNKWSYDPTKWLIWTCSKIKMAKGLKLRGPQT